MTQKEKRQQDKIIFERLPKEARCVVRSNSQKQAAAEKIVKRIYKQYGSIISALAKN